MKKATAERDRLLDEILLAKAKFESLTLRLQAQKMNLKRIKLALLFGGKAESILEIESLISENERILRGNARRIAALVEKWVHLHVVAFIERQQWRILSREFEEYDDYRFLYVIAADIPRVQTQRLFQDFYRLVDYFGVVGKVVIQFDLETADDLVEIPYAEVCCT